MEYRRKNLHVIGGNGRPLFPAPGSRINGTMEISAYGDDIPGSVSADVDDEQIDPPSPFPYATLETGN